MNSSSTYLIVVSAVLLIFCVQNGKKCYWKFCCCAEMRVYIYIYVITKPADKDMNCLCVTPILNVRL